MKVFVFCIGGTGIRVMKSIMMLLAAGMDTEEATIVPVLVDPHRDLEERQNLQALIADYKAIYDRINNNGGEALNPLRPGFFATKVNYLGELAGDNNDVAEPVAEHRAFSEYINYGQLPAEDLNCYLVQTLFSQQNLDSPLSVGFRGSPNVGTVVLGEMINGADWFKAFCTNCEDGDRVFIISSIFGGTGASGFPLLEKTIRQETDRPTVCNAMIGAVSVLPYYSLEDPATTGSAIDSTNFFTKTKAALAYYEHGVKPDYLYYVGEQSLRTTYDNNEQLQKDQAHFVELAAATALFDFIHKTSRPDTPQVLTRSIHDDADSLSLLSLGDSYKMEVKAVADLMLLHLLVKRLPDERFFPLQKDRGFDEGFYRESAFGKLSIFLDAFKHWYDELASNKRAFAPLNTEIEGGTSLANLIRNFTLDGKDVSYYLLELIRRSNQDNDASHAVKFRRFLDYAYKAINNFTRKITL